MKLVVIESPYAGNIPRNELYARIAMRDSLNRGEAPIASHLLYTQVLDDTEADERTLGIEAGFAWNQHADLVALYADYGISSGMEHGIRNAARLGQRVEFRYIGRIDATA